jgi:hypothetical protein
MASDFTVTVQGERGDEFKSIFGTNVVHVCSPFPTMAHLEGKAEAESVYMLDLEMLTVEQQGKLIVHLANKFSADPAAVEAAVMALGLPIRASDTVVTVSNPQKWLLDDEPWNKADATEEVEPMSDLDDEPFDEYDGFDEY